MASTTPYIINFNKKTGVFTLTSTKDEVKVDAKHKKYEWLKNQEAGRIVKISDKGRWNSSKDYNGLYKSIKPIKKIVKKPKTNKSNVEKAGAYCFSFHEKEEQFVLTNQEDIKITITSKHKKYEWLKSQDAGRVIKISDKGRWNSSKDYNGLYDEINTSTSKKKSTVKTTKRKTKSVEATPSSLKINELATLKETILHLKNKLQVREKEWKGLLKAKEYDKQVIYQLKQLGSERKKEIQLLKTKIHSLKNEIQLFKTKNTSLRNEIQLLKKKPQRAKPKPKPKPQPRKYNARITATLKYEETLFDKAKKTENLDVEIITKRLDKKPAQSMFKSYLRLAVAKGRYYDQTMDFDMPIDYVRGLHPLAGLIYHKNQKISNISFISIEED
jgi:chromosome segregation ATPase